MEQRRLRLGDILDDYCPRERRLTNHAVVAMIEENVKQTRCTTCDTEHPYKGGKIPKRRKKETTATLYKEVLAGQNSREDAHIVLDHDSDHAEIPSTPVVAEPVISAVPVDVPTEPVVGDQIEEPVAAAESSEPGEAPVEMEEGPVHRPLIRAQLPRIEGQKEERRPPDFTIRQRGSGPFRGDSRMKPYRHAGNGHAGNGGANGNRGQGGSRFAGQQRPSGSGGRGQSGRGGGGQPGFRQGPRPGGGRKRSR
jgi:hypothetical protein